LFQPLGDDVDDFELLLAIEVIGARHDFTDGFGTGGVSQFPRVLVKIGMFGAAGDRQERATQLSCMWADIVVLVPAVFVDVSVGSEKSGAAAGGSPEKFIPFTL